MPFTCSELHLFRYLFFSLEACFVAQNILHNEHHGKCNTVSTLFQLRWPVLTKNTTTKTKCKYIQSKCTLLNMIHYVMLMTYVCSPPTFVSTNGIPRCENIYYEHFFLWTDDIALDMLYLMSFVYFTYIIFLVKVKWIICENIFKLCLDIVLVYHTFREGKIHNMGRHIWSKLRFYLRMNRV